MLLIQRAENTRKYLWFAANTASKHWKQFTSFNHAGLPANTDKETRRAGWGRVKKYAVPGESGTGWTRPVNSPTTRRTGALVLVTPDLKGRRFYGHASRGFQGLTRKPAEDSSGELRCWLNFIKSNIKLFETRSLLFWYHDTYTSSCMYTTCKQGTMMTWCTYTVPSLFEGNWLCPVTVCACMHVCVCVCVCVGVCSCGGRATRRSSSCVCSCMCVLVGDKLRSSCSDTFWSQKFGHTSHDCVTPVV